MSCLHPIEIYNRSEKISYRASSLIYTVPCGQCEECKKSKTAEYCLRSFVEYQDTVSKGGYVYFDTLTYSPKFCPETFGIKHFMRSDVTLFLKELRIYLTRAGYDVNGKLKYFITSEYGGKRHRPHYHILLFVCVPGLDVKTLWKYMHKAWKFGILDSYKSCTSRVVNSSAALNYVSKYVQKDQEWMNVIDKKISRLRKLGMDKSLEDFNEFVRCCKPFHRSSQGFGVNFLKFINLDSVIKNGFITIPDRKYLVKNYAIPMYYKRKLFYTLYKDDEGKLHWRLNDNGIEYKVNQLDKLIATTTQYYRDIFNNLWSYNYDHWYDENTVRDMILKYLGNRTFEDLARYAVVFRNKVWFSKNPLLNYKDFYRESLKTGKYISHMYDEDPSVRSSFRSKMSSHIINSQRFLCFRGFDELISLFRIIVKPVNDGHERQVQRIQSLRDRLKLVLGAA